jgi:hypothetical protein
MLEASGAGSVILIVGPSTFMNASETCPRRLQVGVWAGVVIVAIGLAQYSMYFLPLGDGVGLSGLFIVGGTALFLAGLCGAFRGLSSMFRLRGFHRLVAILIGLLSLYAVVRCAGFMRWAIALP